MYMFEKQKKEQAVSPEAVGSGAGCAEGEGASLAMVYSPRQYWRDAYTPAEALDRGTLFKELDKPLTFVCAGGDPA